MRKQFLNVLLMFLVFMLGASQMTGQVSHGRVLEGLTIESEILKKDMRYSIYLPFDYETSERYYPVVYLLHGYTDNDMAWFQYGEINMKADKAIAKGLIPPVIIVMPDAGLNWYINNYDGSVAYEDYFFEEFIPEVESRYRIRQEKRFRGIAGLSMGGFGSLVYSLKHPGMFAACAAFSAAITPPADAPKLDQHRWDRAFGPVYGEGLEGKERVTDHFLANNPFQLVREGEKEKLNSVRYYIDCGDDDHLSNANNIFHNVLLDEVVKHEYRVRDGGHSWSYWRSGIMDGIQFIGESFHQF